MTESPRLGVALFNADHTHLADEIARIEAAGLDFIHHDVFDGHFVADLGFSQHTIAQLRPLTSLPFEVHLGVNQPMKFIPQLALAGANLVWVHIESITMPYETLLRLREQKLKAGLALTLGTPIDILSPVLPYLDSVLLLSRLIGENVPGASFEPKVIHRIEHLRAIADSAGFSRLDIQVAGGVKRAHIADLVSAGATSIAVGSGIYRVENMANEVAEIRKLIATTHG